MTKSVKRLYETFKPSHYTLHITPDSEAMYFTGSVEIKGKKTGRPSERLTFHQNGLKITKAAVVKHDKKGDQEVAITRINNQDTLHEVRLHSDIMLYPSDYTIYMEFEAPITPHMAGLYPCYFQHEGQQKKLLMTQFESHHAREMFPCIDEPEAKATFDFSLTATTGLTALSNMPIKATSDNDDNTTTTVFDTSPKMSTYLLAFVLGEMHSKTGTTKNGVSISIWATVAQPKERFDFALDTAIKAIDYFEDYFKIPYPLPKYDQVAVPDFSSAAMENWGLVTYREMALMLDPKTSSQSSKELIAEVISHETTHQWFGNLVTMKWWDDLWLNESFANMMAYAAVNSMHPEWQVWDSFVTGEGLSALRRDATPGVQPVKIDVNHPDEIGTLFDPSIVYAKGGRLLYMLKNFIGEETFRAGLQEYFTKHAYQNTAGKDLWDCLSTASGKDIAAFMDPWLERSGYPVVTVDQQGKELTLSQEHFSDNPEKSDKSRLWDIPTFTDTALVPESFSTAKITTELRDSDFITINKEARGHYIVRYKNTDHRTHLRDQVTSQKLSVIDRLMLLSDSSMLSRAGYQSFSATLELLEAYKNESAEPVWDIMSLVLADTRRFIEADEALEDSIKQYIRPLIVSEFDRLGWEEKTEEPAADQKLRATILGLGAYSETPEITAHAKKLFTEYQTNPEVVSAELRGIIFTVAIKDNVPGAVDYLLKLYQETNDSDLQRDIAGALTATRRRETAAMLLDLLKDKDIVKPQDADRWAFYMLRNRHIRETAWQWMEDNWEWIAETYRKDKSFDYWPRYAAAVCATKEWQDKYVSFFTPKLDDPMLKRNIEIGLEEIQNRISWIDRDLKAVQGFFKNL